MSPYRVPCWPPAPAPPRWTRFMIAAALATAFVGAATTGAWLEARDARNNEAIWTQLAIRASEDENARRIVELQGSRFDHTEKERAAVLRAVSEESRTTRTLPRCRCAAGDPLCSEIPGQTCAQ